MSDVSLFGDTTGVGPDLSAPDYTSYNDTTPSDQIANQDSNTGFSDTFPPEQTLSFGGVPNNSGPLPALQSGLFQGTDPFQSLTPNSANQAAPDFFSQLFNSAGKALSTPSSAAASSFGQIFGNLAQRAFAPLAQGRSSTPGTQNYNSAGIPNSFSALLSNPLVLIGGAILIILIIKE